MSRSCSISRHCSIARKSNYTSYIVYPEFAFRPSPATILFHNTLSKPEIPRVAAVEIWSLAPRGKNMTIVSYSCTEFTKGRVTRCFLLFARLIASLSTARRVFLQTIQAIQARYHWYMHIYIYMCIGLDIGSILKLMTDL